MVAGEGIVPVRGPGRHVRGVYVILGCLGGNKTEKTCLRIMANTAVIKIVTYKFNP